MSHVLRLHRQLTAHGGPIESSIVRPVTTSAFHYIDEALTHSRSQAANGKLHDVEGSARNGRYSSYQYADK